MLKMTGMEKSLDTLGGLISGEIGAEKIPELSLSPTSN
jgi:hypothetical protein